MVKTDAATVLDVAIERIIRVIWHWKGYIHLIKYELRFVRPDGKSRLAEAFVSYQENHIEIAINSEFLNDGNFEYDLSHIVADFYKTCMYEYKTNGFDAIKKSVSDYAELYKTIPLYILAGYVENSCVNFTEEQFIVYCIFHTPKYPMRVLELYLTYSDNIGTMETMIELSETNDVIKIYRVGNECPFCVLNIKDMTDYDKLGKMIELAAYNFVSAAI